MIVELKFDGSAEGAIAQVRERNYPQLVQEFTDRLLLVGINYNKKTKRHECRIEKWVENASEGLSNGLSWKQVAENLEINPDKVGLLVPLMRQPVLLKDLRIACGFTQCLEFAYKVTTRNVIEPLLFYHHYSLCQPYKETIVTEKIKYVEKLLPKTIFTSKIMYIFAQRNFKELRSRLP
ncbi:MAG: hypothetical protein KBT41_00655 [bacterium]|nr:hypothetical protein [Candidatus Colousia faecequi]